MITTRLVVDGVELDLGGVNIPFPTTYRIADIKEPDKRKRNKTKTVVLPGNRINKSFFSSAWDVSLADVDGNGLIGFNFDPSQRSEAKYYEGGELIFDGLLQLLSVKKLNGVYSFEVSLFSNFVDVFRSVDKINISELGWGEYDHVLNRTNISNSWATSVIVDGVATSNFTAGVPDGFGYLYPHIDWGYSTTLQSLTTTDIVPVVYFKEVFEKILEFNGFTIDSTFMSTERYKRLVMAWEGGEKQQVSTTELARRASELTGDLSYTESFNYFSTQFVDRLAPLTDYYQISYSLNDIRTLYSGIITSPTVTQGNYNAMNTSTYLYTVPQKGNYKITFAGSIDVDISFSAAVTNPQILQTPKARFVILRNGSPIYFQDWEGVLGSTVNFTVDIDRDFTFDTSDVIECRIEGSGIIKIQDTDLNNLPTLDVNVSDTGAGIELDIICIDAVLTDGDTVQISRFLPKMKCSDFLRSQIRMFNLYITEPDANGVVSIEPLEDFYQATTIFDDWSELLDHSMEIDIIPSSQLVKGKRYNFKWKQSDDYYNKLYRDKYQIGYGDKVYEVQSTFQDGDVNYEVPFSQSVPVQIDLGFITPRIINVDPLTEAVSPFKGAPRCFVYNGLVSGNWRLKNESDHTSYNDYTTYPQVNHLQDLDNADFDLNFDKPEIVYWDASAYTTDNLWKYHEKFIREVTGRDAKVIRAYFKLGSKEVTQGFDRLVMINGVLFRRNEIKDYEAGAYAPTMVELVRIIEGDSPEITEITELPNLPGADYSEPLTGATTGGQDAGVISGGINQTNETSSKING